MTTHGFIQTEGGDFIPFSRRHPPATFFVVDVPEDVSAARVLKKLGAITYQPRMGENVWTWAAIKDAKVGTAVQPMTYAEYLRATRKEA